MNNRFSVFLDRISGVHEAGERDPLPDVQCVIQGARWGVQLWDEIQQKMQSKFISEKKKILGNGNFNYTGARAPTVLQRPSNVLRPLHPVPGQDGWEDGGQDVCGADAGQEL